MPSQYVASTPTSMHPAAGLMLGLAASLAFATSGAFVRPLLDAGWTPLAAVFWRVCAASVLLLPLGLWSIRGRLRLLLTEWRLILSFGVLAVATAQGMYFAAVSRMSVSVALLIEYMAPVALVLLAWLRQRHAPSKLVLAGAAVSVAGLFFVLDLSGARLDGLGVLFGLGAMTGAAAYFALGARRTELPALALPAFGLPVGAAALGLLIASGVLPYSAPLVPVDLMGAQVPWWVPLGVVVVFATAAAYALGVAGIALMGERLSSFVSLSEVLFAALVAAVVLGEIPTGMQIIGGVLIVVGVVLIRVSTGNAPAGIPALPDEIEIGHAQ
ncbi:EamA family transporter [Propionicimonas sp.]|uniref:EamA family transporter n=1 Tax=Propionicimonas sp. TaxID=1955623 RepID=UPI0025D747C6|nr:EamA family transporter [Propionicimonas sp.]MCG2804394.1 DMT family transporter [Propionicimonas sp.]